MRWGELQLPLPSPAEALAQLRPCGNPLCTELGGDSEARVQLKACARCGTVAYCCRCGEALCGLKGLPDGALAVGPQGRVRSGGRQRGGRQQRLRWSLAWLQRRLSPGLKRHGRCVCRLGRSRACAS